MSSCSSGEFGSDTDAVCLAEILRGDNPDMQIRAIKELGSGLSGSDLILQALFELLQGPEEDVAIAAIDALARFQNAGAVPHLVACLKVEALAPTAAAALKWFDTREARNALKAWNRNKKE